ncbi:hypothetical protein Syun_004499 [Stephania yunnanensis]|uniref:Squalene monooxygenase n=1 Tax=Stephania yunnanensis TaxID=152371 RepID=A0AAP0Q0V6_9MAGN
MIEYIVGALVASLLGFLFFFNLHDRRRRRWDSGEEELGFDQIRDECVKSAANGECGSDKMSAVDVIVVGAGVAGSALAYTLGKIQFDPYMLSGLQSGRRVHVIERDLSEPDRIVGELLQPGGYLKLIELGLEDCVDEIDAQRVVGYALFKDGKSAKLSYPLEKFHSDVSGRSFHNGRFIQRMREKAGSLPNVSLEQGSVTSLLDDNGTIKGVVYKTKTGEELKAYAPLTIVPPEIYDSFVAAPLRDLNDASSLCSYLESFYTLRKPVASTINTLAGALYKVFSASPDLARKEMRQACFDYLSLGGIFSSGPVALLSGLNPRPLSLFCHFFAVAIYGVGRLLLPFPSPKRLWLGARLISAASGIIFPIIKAEGVRQMFFPATVPAIYRAPPLK